MACFATRAKVYHTYARRLEQPDNCAERYGLCLFEFEHKDLGTGCFYTILTLTFAKKRGGKGLLCLNTSYVPELF